MIQNKTNERKTVEIIKDKNMKHYEKEDREEQAQLMSCLIRLCKKILKGEIEDGS